MRSNKSLAAELGLTLGAVGVVFGDIGTSPLYALAECFKPGHGVTPTADNVYGVLSLVFWSFILVVSIKYVFVLLRADNEGEGGILALLALLPKVLQSTTPGHVGRIALVAIAGAALLYGDGMITPAISVLAAVEGLEVGAPELKEWVIPLTCIILFLLFWVQRRGTGRLAMVFGPVMILWFITVGLIGLANWIHHPEVLKSLSPYYAVHFFMEHGMHGLRALGSVILCITGVEALYADMGHFGRKPIQRAWSWIVLPCLVSSYFGQGAHLIANPADSPNLFYSMVPKGPLFYVILVLATAATVIASQALISGVFSLTHQAIRLGYFPRLTVRHTSSEVEGRIYIPLINWGLATACICLVLMFKKSTEMTAAYGLAVSGTMALTTVVFYYVTRYGFRWSKNVALGFTALFLTVDMAFVMGNLFKFMDGGYLPFLVGAGFFIVMVTWRRGRSLLAVHLGRQYLPWDQVMEMLDHREIRRVQGVGVCMSSVVAEVPPVLAQMVRRFHVLHEKVILLTVTTEERPHVPASERLRTENLSHGFYRLITRYGFMEIPNVPAVLQEAMPTLGFDFDIRRVDYMLGRETIIPGEKGRWWGIGEHLFAFLTRNSRNATYYFKIPPDQVVELGAQIDL